MKPTGRRITAVAVAVIASSFACTDLAPTTGTARSLDINAGLLTIQVGQTIQATAALRDAVGAPIEGVEVGWSSSNPQVATVSPGGLVTGVASGTTNISVSALGLSASAPLTVIPASATAAALSITTPPPASARSGVAFAAQPTVQLRDGSGVAVAQAGVIVTASIVSGGGTLGGLTIGSTNASGVAAFDNLSISGTVGPRTLSFSAAGFPPVTSGTIDITAGPANSLSVTSQPSATVQSSIAMAEQPVVQVRDASGNTVSQAGLTVVAAIANGGGTLGGSAAVTTDANGVATFTDLAITGTPGNRTLSFTTSGLTPATSGTISVTAGTPSPAAVTITTQPSIAAQSGVVLARQPVVQVIDGTGSPVNVAGTSVTAAIATGAGNLVGTTTVTTNANGVATFTDLSITGIVGPRTLAFTSGSLTTATSGTISVSAGAPVALSISTQPSLTAPSGAGLAIQPVIQVRDVNDNPVKQAGIPVTAAIASGGGTLLGAVSVGTDANGAATFTNLAILGTPGVRTLTFTSGALLAATSGAIDITAAVVTPSALAITSQPSSTAASGALFVQQPAVRLVDSSGATVKLAGVPVTAAIAAGGGTLSGTTTVTTKADGVATFTDLSIAGTIGARTLTFTSGSLTAVTADPIAVSAGSASALTITTQPSVAALSSVAFAQQPSIQVRDGAGNAVSQAGLFVSAAIASGGGTLGGSVTTATNTNGVAAFPNLSITGTAGPRTLSFTLGSLTPATSNSIDITAPSALTITTQPSATALSGAVFAQQPVIQVLDGNGSAANLAGVSVTVAIASGGGTLNGTKTVATNASGIAAFTNLSITGAAGARTLAFTSGSLTPATSSSIGVTIPPGLTITTQPSATAQSGSAFAQQPAIQLRDGSGNALSQAGVTVTAAIVTGGGTLGGTATATTSATGLATFTGLAISGTVGTRTLSFSANGFTSVTSSGVSITPGPAAALSIAAQPSGSATTDVPFATQPTVQLRDAATNAVSQSGVVVTVALASGTGTLNGTTTATTNSNGVAAFLGLSITGSGNHTLSFSATGLTPATSNIINVGSAPSNGEPVFTPATDTSLLGAKDGTFDSYAAISAVTAQFSTNGTLISPGNSGSAHAIRLTYTPSGTGVEPFQYLGTTWTRRNHVIVSFSFRTSVGADPTGGRFNSSGFKWLILRRDGNAGDPNGRITAGVHSLQQGFQYGTPDNGVQFTVNDQSVVAGGFWQNITKSIGWNATNGNGTTNRAIPVNDGNWHRYTIDADPFNDLVQVWVDGTLIISSVGLPYAMFDQGWDELGLGQNVVPDLPAGFGFTIDYDDLKVWVRGAGAAPAVTNKAVLPPKPPR